jgi:hypothetical protein
MMNILGAWPCRCQTAPIVPDSHLNFYRNSPSQENRWFNSSHNRQHSRSTSVCESRKVEHFVGGPPKPRLTASRFARSVRTTPPSTTPFSISHLVKPHFALQKSPIPFRLLPLPRLYIRMCMEINILFVHYSLSCEVVPRRTFEENLFDHQSGETQKKTAQSSGKTKRRQNKPGCVEARNPNKNRESRGDVELILLGQ